MAVLKVPVTPDDHIQGNEDAPVTVVEYGDYECPHCGIAYYIVKSLQKQYGRLLRLVFRNFFAKHPAVRRRILLELARGLQFRKRLLKVVGRIPKHT